MVCQPVLPRPKKVPRRLQHGNSVQHQLNTIHPNQCSEHNTMRMGPMHVSCQLNLKLFVSKQYDFSPIVSCQLSQNLKFRVCKLSVRLVCQLSVKNMDDCQLSVNPI